jgi:hypothetical protein
MDTYYINLESATIRRQMLEESFRLHGNHAGGGGGGG